MSRFFKEEVRSVSARGCLLRRTIRAPMASFCARDRPPAELGVPALWLLSAPSDVAQVSNLLYRRFPIGRAWRCGERWIVRGACGLETRDTADWKSALRRGVVTLDRYPALAGCGVRWPPEGGTPDPVGFVESRHGIIAAQGDHEPGARTFLSASALGSGQADKNVRAPNSRFLERDWQKMCFLNAVY